MPHCASAPFSRLTFQRYMQVIPEGARCVKGVGDRGWGFFASRQTCRSRRRGQGSRGARPRQRPEGLEVGAVRQTMWRAEKIAVGSRGVRGVGRCAHQCRWARRSASPGEAAGHSFARVDLVAGMMGFAVLRSTGSIRTERPRRCRSRNCRGRRRGGHDLHDPRPTEFSGGAHAAAAAGSSVVVGARGRGGRAARSRPTRFDGGRRRPRRCCVPRRAATRSRKAPTVWAGQGLDRLHRGPADQPGALLGDPAPAHLGVGLVVLGGHPGPAAQLLGGAEAVHVADLGDEHRAEDRADPRDLSAPRIAGVADQPSTDDAGEHVDLEVQVLDQPAQRDGPGPGTGRAAGRVSRRSSRSIPPMPNRSVSETWIPHLASTACTWALHLLRRPTSLAR